jgi:hypothetical protein
MTRGLPPSPDNTRMPIVTRDIHFDRVKNIERLAW